MNVRNDSHQVLAGEKEVHITEELPLFRKQVLDARMDKFSGPITLAQPMSRMTITIASAILIAAVIAFMLLLSINRTAHVSGVTVPIDGALPVLAPAGGVITAIEANEGQRVLKGDVIFRITNEQMSQGGDTVKMIAAQLALRREGQNTQLALRLRQYEEDLNSLNHKLGNAEIEEAQLNDEIALAKNRMELVKNDLSNQDTLRDAGFISQAQRRQKEQESLDVLARLKALQRSLTLAQRGRITVSEELASLKSRLDIDLNQIKSTMSSIDQQIIENEAKKAIVIIAAQDGIVSTINVKLGQMAIRDRSLATLVPVTRNKITAPMLEVQLFVPGQTIGFVEAGQNVFMRYPAYPYQLFGLQKGRVIDVSRTPLLPSELPDLVAGIVMSNTQSSIQGNGREALYRVRIAIDSQTVRAYGRDYQLRPGMTLEADVVREKQKIWELFFAPALAMARNNF